jgi:hypothetical protein
MCLDQSFWYLLLLRHLCHFVFVQSNSTTGNLIASCLGKAATCKSQLIRKIVQVAWSVFVPCNSFSIPPVDETTAKPEKSSPDTPDRNWQPQHRMRDARYSIRVIDRMDRSVFYTPSATNQSPFMRIALWYYRAILGQS